MELSARKRKGSKLQCNESGGISWTLANAVRLLNFDNSQSLAWLPKAERKQFALTLGAKATPPNAAQLSQKKLKYHQKMRNRQEIGDRMLQSMSNEVPTIEELMVGGCTQYFGFFSRAPTTLQKQVCGLNSIT